MGGSESGGTDASNNVSPVACEVGEGRKDERLLPGPIYEPAEEERRPE
jgi:hypothetical protein